jgi:predicted lysophospholipase L1 biosynthesis ABC-type transport system permease subunit
MGARGGRPVQAPRAALLSVRAASRQVRAALVGADVDRRADGHRPVEPGRAAAQGDRGGTAIRCSTKINTFEQLATASLARQRFLLLLFGIFAALALLLACIGIYGVLAYLTSQRVPEIGVRMALGATAPRVVWMVLRQSLTMIFAGIVVGAAGSWLATRSAVRLVEGVRAAEPSTFALMIGVLVIAALFASFLPGAPGQPRIDPMKALRQD